MAIINEVIEGYRIVIYVDEHEIPGAYCLPPNVRSGVEHLNVNLYDETGNREELYNAHVGTYERGDKICMFYYDSVSKVCNTSCLDRGDFSLSAVESFLSDSVDEAEINGADVLRGIATGAIVALILAAWAVPLIPPTPP